ncbi:hypothetical protein CVT24_000276 [Panaeolus cyanescens]|uniref:Calcineurin-like phosphoesterase domain-containing protein n=1 Tax=Panaeolus cyanescens TaxID=181874 RepID=A0A409YD89_9AGAR|nr:hypothetical protein CVT24_000276 [Panaeolus cyanescens]
MATPTRRRSLINFLRVTWVLVILWYEYFTFLSSGWSCHWPDASLLPSRRDIDTTHKRPCHVLLVADPQVLDYRSYPRRGVLLSYITRSIVNLNLRKNWRAALGRKPDAVVFLGNMLDNGRLKMSNEEYEIYFQRFKHIFRLKKEIPQYYIPGNRDVGLGHSNLFDDRAFDRYISHFGEPNYEVSVANHTLVFLDTPGYADEDAKRYGAKKTFDAWVPIPGGTLEFMNTYASHNHTDPTIVFSHIPFYRADGKSCGPHRERGTIRPGVGLGYQNVLEKQSSHRLLSSFKPVAIFSGDDHDYCEHNHQYQSQDGSPHVAREVTVKSLSMVMNVRRPGFQLLSLNPTEFREGASKPTFADAPCLLPDQLHIYLAVYLPLLLVSLLLVFASNFGQRTSHRHLKSSSDTTVIRASAGGRDSDPEDIPPTSYTTLSNRLSSTQHHYNKHGLRSPHINMSFANQGQRRRIAGASETVSFLSRIRRAVNQPWSGGVSNSSRRRREWLMPFLRDARDIAIFPLGMFVLITLWVVT